MSFFAKIFGNSSKSSDTQSQALSVDTASAALDEAQESASAETDPKELAAVIMAAIMCMMPSGRTGDLQIRSIKRIGRNNPVWNTAGRDKYIATRL